MGAEEDLEECVGCGSTDIRIDSGVDGGICRHCGLVQSEGDTETEVRTQIEVNPEKSTDTSWVDEVSIQDATDALLVDALSKTETIVERLKLGPSVQTAAVELVAEVWQESFMHGRKMEVIIGACVFIEARRSGTAVPAKRVADATGVEESRVQRVYWDLMQELELRTPSATADCYITYLGEDLGLSNLVQQRASEILEGTHGPCGNPAGIAAGALYVAAKRAGEDLTLRTAGSAAGVRKETVWTKSKDLREQL